MVHSWIADAREDRCELAKGDGGENPHGALCSRWQFSSTNDFRSKSESRRCRACWDIEMLIAARLFLLMRDGWPERFPCSQTDASFHTVGLLTNAVWRL